MAGQWFHLPGERIDESLEIDYRQYFVGKLSRPQALEHIEADGLEFGTSRYDGFSADQPHLHTESVECIYVLNGNFTILLLDSREEVRLGAGDFFALQPGHAYASKTDGARVLFVKAPGDKDKVAVEVDDDVHLWLKTPSGVRELSPGAEEPAIPPLSPEVIAPMYAIYQSEWEHRDTVLWSTAFRVFFTALLIALLPYLEGYFSVDLPFPAFAFASASLLLTVYFFVLTLAYGERLAAAGATLAALQEQLDPRLRRIPVGSNLPGTRIPLVNAIVKMHIAWWTPILMASFLLLVNAAVLVGVYAV